MHLTPHQWRRTFGTRLINRDVPQEVVRRILDHDSHRMTARYARLSDTTIRRHWEAARKANIAGETVTLDLAGPLAEAAWAKQRVGRATQALPNGYCGLPVVKTCPHANACLTCPRFVTTAEFLPPASSPPPAGLEIITTADARGQQRLAEMNQQVLGNLDRIIAALETDPTPTGRRSSMRADNAAHLVLAARRRHELTRSKAIQAVRELDDAGAAVTFKAVARTAGISRSWLYTQPDLQAEIQQRRDHSRSRGPPATTMPARQRATDASLLQRLELVNARNRELAQDNQRLRRQLAHALGQLRAAGIREPDEPAFQVRATRRSSVTIGRC